MAIEVARAAIDDALHAAGGAELPAAPLELLEFVRAHLAPRVTEEVGPHLALALIDDLAAEIEQIDDPASVTRMRASTMAPPPGSDLQGPSSSPPAPEARQPDSGRIGTPVAKLVCSAKPAARFRTRARNRPSGPRVCASLGRPDGAPRRARPDGARFHRPRAALSAKFEVAVVESVDEARARRRRSSKGFAVRSSSTCAERRTRTRCERCSTGTLRSP